MKRWSELTLRRKFLCAATVLILAAAIWFVWPRGYYRLSRVHTSLRQLQTPYRTVWTSFYLDGGSVAIRIVDRDGRSVEFLSPVFIDSPRPPRYERLFYGSISLSSTNLVEIPQPKDTERMLADMSALGPSEIPSLSDFAVRRATMSVRFGNVCWPGGEILRRGTRWSGRRRR